MEDNPTGCMGLPDYLGRKSKGEIPIVCVPGCPVQADNFMETLALADWGLNELDFLFVENVGNLSARLRMILEKTSAWC
jgi:Ni2+-binding GTPase involved in maturation of urease and hydrogenase